MAVANLTSQGYVGMISPNRTTTEPNFSDHLSGRPVLVKISMDLETWEQLMLSFSGRYTFSPDRQRMETSEIPMTLRRRGFNYRQLHWLVGDFSLPDWPVDCPTMAMITWEGSSQVVDICP